MRDALTPPPYAGSGFVAVGARRGAAPANDHSKGESNTFSLPAMAPAVTGFDRCSAKPTAITLTQEQVVEMRDQQTVGHATDW